MTIYLIRHAHAGQRGHSVRNDDDRPLSARGITQAEMLADQLGNVGIGHLVSSPARRCVETLEPLGKRLGLPITVEDVLSEGSAASDTIGFLQTLDGESAAICSHGDVIPESIDLLQRQGMTIIGEPGWSKAGRWEITTASGSSTPFPTARYIPLDLPG